MEMEESMAALTRSHAPVQASVRRTGGQGHRAAARRWQPSQAEPPCRTAGRRACGFLRPGRASMHGIPTLRSFSASCRTSSGCVICSTTWSGAGDGWTRNGNGRCWFWSGSNAWRGGFRFLPGTGVGAGTGGADGPAGDRRGMSDERVRGSRTVTLSGGPLTCASRRRTRWNRESRGASTGSRTVPGSSAGRTSASWSLKTSARVPRRRARGAASSGFATGVAGPDRRGVRDRSESIGPEHDRVVPAAGPVPGQRHVLVEDSQVYAPGRRTMA